MMSIKRAWLPVATAAALVLASPMLGYVFVDDTAEAAAVAPYRMPSGMVHCTLEFEPDADLNHYADWVLDQVGVPEDEWGGRKPQTGPDDHAALWELDMVFLFLTQEECDDAVDLTGTGPLVNVEATSVVSLPSPVEGGGPWVAPGDRGRQTVPAGILRIGTPVDEWVSSPAANGVRVAVVDTGIDGRHPDLNVVGGFNCTQDHRGPLGFDIDEHGHGTHVAGTIGAKFNDRDVVGVAPGVALLSEVTFGAEGSASGAMVLCAVNAALRDDADIISASLGGGEIASRCGGPSVYTNGWCKAARRAIVVVAAGNDAENAIHHAPANVPGVVTVGAIIDYDGVPGALGTGYPGCGYEHLDDYLAVFSNFGEVVRVVAPGGCVESTLPGEMTGWMSGTSMATPHVSGVFAAFLAKFPDCRGDEAIRTVLNYAQRWADRHPDDEYDGWRGADPPPLIRYVAEEPLRIQPDPEEPRPCAFESEVRS